MADSLASSRTDMRSAAVDQRRAKSNRKKWSPRWSYGFDASKVRPDGSKRPGRLHSSSSAVKFRMENEKRFRIVNAASKEVILEYASDLPSDDSSDASSQTECSPHDEIFYSYDAPTGPVAGAHVLYQAVDRAVERFEDGQTAKLVREEYEVLETPEGDHKNKNDTSNICDEEDFEFV